MIQQVTATDLGINSCKWPKKGPDEIIPIGYVKAAGFWKLDKYAHLRQLLRTPAKQMTVETTEGGGTMAIMKMGVGKDRREAYVMDLSDPAKPIDKAVTGINCQLHLVIAPSDPGMTPLMYSSPTVCHVFNRPCP